ncbi:hypothetical protein Mapa_012697 [Marchantia paleacea]|nr:hypothetical protein Mapa_012697 [Marchantia paleacea]
MSANYLRAIDLSEGIARVKVSCFCGSRGLLRISSTGNCKRLDIMGVKVYGTTMSAATRNVMIVLMEKDVDFELVTVDMKSLGHKKPEHLAMNPFGKIPVYQDDDITLFDPCGQL